MTFNPQNSLVPRPYKQPGYEAMLRTTEYASAVTSWLDTSNYCVEAIYGNFAVNRYTPETLSSRGSKYQTGKFSGQVNQQENTMYLIFF